MKNALWVVLVVLFSFAVSTVDAEPMEFAESPTAGWKIGDGPKGVYTTTEIAEAGGINLLDGMIPGITFPARITVDVDNVDKVIVQNYRGEQFIIRKVETLAISSERWQSKIPAKIKNNTLYLYPKTWKPLESSKNNDDSQVTETMIVGR